MGGWRWRATLRRSSRRETALLHPLFWGVASAVARPMADKCNVFGRQAERTLNHPSTTTLRRSCKQLPSRSQTFLAVPVCSAVAATTEQRSVALQHLVIGVAPRGSGGASPYRAVRAAAATTDRTYYGSGDLPADGAGEGDAVFFGSGFWICWESLSANRPASRPATPAATLSG